MLTALALSSLPCAQAPTQLPPPQQATATVAFAPSGEQPDVPQPPRGAVREGPGKVFPPVPIGSGTLPQPHSPPSMPRSGPGEAGIAAPCDLRFFVNTPVATTGTLSTTCEPNVGIHGDTVLYTSNWTAGLSRDSGQSWTTLNPYTRFPAVDGGFCCDQRVVHVPNPGLTVWLLEYSYSATTQGGRLRIAYARNQNDLRNDAFAYFDLTPQLFGQSARFLDYSDIAYSNTHLYGSAIVGSPPNNPAGLVLWRAPLADLWNGGNIGIQYYLSGTLGGFGSYRFAQGSTEPMYFAAHTSTTNLRVFSWPSNGNATWVDRTVAQWSGTATASLGPDGRDWASFAYTVNTVLSGYTRFGEVGFLWSSGSVANRPQTFVRVARFRTPDLALTGQDDIWNPSVAFHFPTVTTNAAGEVGGVLAFGGGGIHPSAAAFMVDSCTPNWAPLSSFTFAAGAAGPFNARWGDYLGIGRHSTVTTTFVAGGYGLDNTARAAPRFLWFGRERDEPGWVDAQVTASDINGPALNVAITIEQTDRFGRKDGVAPFSRSYPPRQRWQITAPARTLDAFGNPYTFRYWIDQGNLQAQGRTWLDVSDLGTGPRTVVAQAKYERAYVIDVDAAPATGVPIAVAPNDLNGNGSGSTRFTREYLASSVVTLSAPAQSGGNLFRYWILNGVPQTPAQTNVFFTVNADVTAIADYGAIAGTGPDWRDISAQSPTVPSGRLGHAMVHHGGLGQLLMFGGNTGGSETWTLDRGTWTQLATTNAPSARFGHTMVYDTAYGRTLLFGGNTGSAETWAFDGVDWNLLTPLTTSPPGRDNAASAFNRGTGRWLLFGGNVGLTRLNDTWTWDGTDWVQEAPTTVPPALSSPSMAYDQARDRCVLIGANANLGFETWEWDGSDWIQMQPLTAPAGRYSTPLTYDPLRARCVLFSGARGFPAPVSDSWEWDGSDWTQRFTTTLPIAREAHALVYDETYNRVVMFGGFQRPFTNLADTWEYFFDCETIGLGHPGGGLPLTCTTRPQIGSSLCLSFPSSQSVGALVLGFTPPARPALPILPPLACNPGDLHAALDLLIDVPGDPAIACLPIPNDPALVGVYLVAQGLALNAASCLDLTDAVLAVVQP